MSENCGPTLPMVVLGRTYCVDAQLKPELEMQGNKRDDKCFIQIFQTVYIMKSIPFVMCTFMIGQYAASY